MKWKSFGSQSQKLLAYVAFSDNPDFQQKVVNQHHHFKEQNNEG
jgi:hypothetical protein